MFVILCVLEVEVGLEGEATPQCSYNSVQKTIPVLSLSSQNQSVANMKLLPLSYRIFHEAVDKGSLGAISSTPAHREVQNSHNILLKKECLVKKIFLKKNVEWLKYFW